MTKKFSLAVIVCLALSSAIVCLGQTRDVCITDEPKPELPSDYGPLDAVTSAIFRVELLADRRIGRVALVKSSHIQRLDDLASAAVERITFIPKMVDGSPVTTFQTVQYRYSWEFGWRVNDLGSQRTCKSELVEPKKSVDDASRVQSLRSADSRDFATFTRHYVAPFKLIGDRPKGFEEFARFHINELPKKFRDELDTDFRGDVPVKGFVLVLTEKTAKTDFGKMVPFAKGTVSIRESSIHLDFRTKTYKGFQYAFHGEYLDTGLASPECETTRLKGTISKIKDRKVIAEAEILLYPFIGDFHLGDCPSNGEKAQSRPAQMLPNPE